MGDERATGRRIEKARPLQLPLQLRTSWATASEHRKFRGNCNPGGALYAPENAAWQDLQD